MKLVKAVTMEKAFINLFNIYAHELSRYNPWLGTQIDLDGNYLSEDVKQYLSDKSNDAYCIIKENRPIGFVVFSYSDDADEKVCYIAEIFLLETSRGMGISKCICKDFWSKHNGTCRLHVLKKNASAAIYWERLIRDCGYAYEKQDHDDQMWFYEIKLT